MKARPLLSVKPPSTGTVWFILIVALATMAGMLCEWRAPGLGRYAQDSLMRARGTLAVADDIVIVAIDEESISRLGQFPWKRELTARVLNTISPVQPKAIALDVLYVEPTEPEDDESLARAVEQAGNVVLGEQLIEKRESGEPERSAWLNLVPEYQLVPLSKTEFAAYNFMLQTSSPIRFQINNAGIVVGLVLQDDEGDISAKKIN